MTKLYKIAVIPGDGIGPEVIQEGVKVLEKVVELTNVRFDFHYFPWGCEYYLQHGRMMAEDGIEQLRQFEAIYLGAVGFPGVPDHISLWDLLLKIRKEFDQYVNIRPITLLDGAPCPLKNTGKEQVDMLFIRENSEGEYAGAGDWLFKGKDNETVLQTSVFSRKGTERIIRYAFETARKTGKSLTSISKGNALNYSMVFWDQVFAEVASEYPDVPTHAYLVDAASMLMIKQPERFQVVVTSNLFGDILTDLGAALAGGLGLAAGANINPERTHPSMFEPIHGSAPDIAGKGIANPLAAIWSASQMLEFFGYEELAGSVLKAIEQVMVEGAVLTPDMGGKASTSEVGDRVVEVLASMHAAAKAQA
ncbi:tartrate dehydrogenase [Brevibacillus agri]|uniref:tartrate dehydrogenase n=1 Tax=Brevibacillus agri TaxID=51101 RepID=UPI001EE56AD4|nr:tartrate dehydrogenase [Brevibacillus agri]MCG5252237.1 tartrate dehydrogenase [Brevibacillus agri]MDN4093960.1 tartrate dehydrogenase [Brevibacillus agri]MED1645420.1 tartrate dehydrogenase [Brevibacillus agri]MED1655189.1 tartrate dehydrogenase [Brevibacillus agri]MED1687245.1 tartrate dehydrogenase [Brevibacillus agri]